MSGIGARVAWRRTHLPSVCRNLAAEQTLALQRRCQHVRYFPSRCGRGGDLSPGRSAPAPVRLQAPTQCQGSALEWLGDELISLPCVGTLPPNRLWRCNAGANTSSECCSPLERLRCRVMLSSSRCGRKGPTKWEGGEFGGQLQKKGHAESQRGHLLDAVTVLLSHIRHLIIAAALLRRLIALIRLLRLLAKVLWHLLDSNRDELLMAATVD